MINGQQECGVQNCVHGIFVLDYNGKGGHVVSLFSLDSTGFSIPEVCDLSGDWSYEESVEVFVVIGSCWVFWSRNVFVMSFDMLVKEMRVQILSKAPGSKHLVEPFLLMDKLVPINNIDSIESSPSESKHEILEVS